VRSFIIMWLQERLNYLTRAEQEALDIIAELSSAGPSLSLQFRRRKVQSQPTELSCSTLRNDGPSEGIVALSQGAKEAKDTEDTVTAGETTEDLDDDDEIFSVDEDTEGSFAASGDSHEDQAVTRPTASVSSAPAPGQLPATDVDGDIPMKEVMLVAKTAVFDSEMTVEALWLTTVMLMKSHRTTRLIWVNKLANHQQEVDARLKKFLKSKVLDQDACGNYTLLQILHWIRLASLSNTLEVDICPACCLHQLWFIDRGHYESHLKWCNGNHDKAHDPPTKKLKNDSPMTSGSKNSETSPFSRYHHETRGSRDRLIAEIEHITAAVAASSPDEPSPSSPDETIALPRLANLCRYPASDLSALIETRRKALGSSKPASEPRQAPFQKNEVIVADAIPSGFHFYSCENCREPVAQNNVECATCPCVYHRACVAGLIEIKDGQWWCKWCSEEDGAKHWRTLLNTGRDVDEASLVGKWVLIFSKPLHRWRKGLIMDR
jgi:hypothetical protein